MRLFTMLLIHRLPKNRFSIQVSKALLAEYIAAKKRNIPFKELGLEHMNKTCPVIPSKLTSSTLRSIQFQVA